MSNRIFNRESSGEHPLVPVLEEWLARKPHDPCRAMANNLVHDHRVTLEREEVLVRYFEAATGDPNRRLKEAIEQYCLREVRQQDRPVFLCRRRNQTNVFSSRGRLPKHSRSEPPRHKDTWLARVLDLNGLIDVYLAARSKGIRHFKSFPRPSGGETRPRAQEVLRWLDERLEGSLARQADVVRYILKAVEEMRRAQPYQPTWATFWCSLESLPGGLNRWAEALGLPNYRSCPRWLIVLKYRWREAGGLVRPTILDAGFNPYHFPSPPQSELERGGHPMDLRLSPVPATLLPEFIHQQIAHPFSHWAEGGHLIQRADGPPEGWLEHRRSNHHQLLKSVYGPEVGIWMREFL